MNEKILNKQNEIIISLLARNKNILGEERIREIVTKKKSNPNNYIKGYNACNGQNQITEISKIVDVKQPTITPILRFWEEEGIIYNVGEKNRPLFVKLLNLREDKNARSEPRDTGRIEKTEQKSSEIDFKE